MNAKRKVRLTNIKVKKLFGYIDYDIDIDPANDVAILSAPNGCGKTSIFKLLNFMFNPSFETHAEIATIPFDFFRCTLTSGHTLQLQRRPLEFVGNTHPHFFLERAKELFGDIFGHNDDLVFSLGHQTLSQIQSINLFSSETTSKLRDIFRYDDDRLIRFRLDRDFLNNASFYDDITECLKQHSVPLNVSFIAANRLQATAPRRPKHTSDGSYYEDRYKDNEPTNFLETANAEMAERIGDCVAEYNALSENAQRRLPLLYLSAADHCATPFSTFEKSWNFYHQELEKFYDLGILERKPAIIEPNELQSAFDQKGPFLTTYLAAFESTLKPLQEHYEKLKLFSDIFHKRNAITRKRIHFTPDGIRVFSHGQEIDLNCLSSGEKNDFIMFYQLIFNDVGSGLVLIDEPEISLHIEWQEEYLDHLIEICEINNLQAIVATHSPNIVSDHFDLFVNKR